MTLPVSGFAPSEASLQFRAKLSNLIRPLCRVRPRVPFFRLPAHTVPTLRLYRSLLRAGNDGVSL